MDKAIDDGAKEVRKWKAITVLLAVIAALSMALPYMESSDEYTDGEIVINNETHGVYQIATVNVESGTVSQVQDDLPSSQISLKSD